MYAWPTCVQGFILVMESGALQICQLPARTLLHTPWLLQKATLRATVMDVCWHKATGHCVLLTAKQVSTASFACKFHSSVAGMHAAFSVTAAFSCKSV